MKNKITAFILSLLITASYMPAVSADEPLPDIPSDTPTDIPWTEKTDRGLVAVPAAGGIYLSWRLYENEDERFGSGDANTAFDIYRNGEKIASEASTTNYIDTEGTASDTYQVTVSGKGLIYNSISIGPDKKTVLVSAANYGLTAYAAKYNDTMLEQVKKFDVTEPGQSEFQTDFDIDKVFLWDGMTPAENKSDKEAILFDSGYLKIPLSKPAPETIYDKDGNKIGTYNFFPADCSTGDLDGDGEYEIVVKWTSNECDVGKASPSGTVRFGAYKLDGTRMWENDINLGRNVYSSAHTAQFLVYDFDGDGKAEMTVQTSRGSKDAAGEYVTKSADPTSKIYKITDEENESADYRTLPGSGLVNTGDEFLTVFDGMTGKAVDTINYPTSRAPVSSWNDNYGNRSNRFLATVAYLDGIKPYAVYWRGYYDYTKGRTGIAGISFDGKRLSVDYQFDTYKNKPGYHKELEDYTGQGNHSMLAADVDNDGRDEIISGALCMEIDEKNELVPKWCSWREHGDAHHIGDYDPTHEGLEYFSVHEHGGGESHGKTLDFGMTVYDAATGEELFHQSNSSDTGRGIMANVGAGGYYQISGAGIYISDGGTDFRQADFSSLGNNFRIFWDGDLYDELLDGTTITDWNGSYMTNIFNANGCVKINGTKSNPCLQADILGDWREEVIYPETSGNALRIYTTTAKTDYKMKSLMTDKVYRMGVSAEQTCYNQPPHIGYYISDDIFYGRLTDIELDTENTKTAYYIGEEFDKTGLTVIGKYSDADDRALTDYSISVYDPMTVGKQTITVKYLDKTAEYDVNVIGEKGISVSAESLSYAVGEKFDKSSIKVKLVYEDDKETEISDYRISGFDSMKVGEQIVTVEYTSITDNVYTAEIKAAVVSGIISDGGEISGYEGDEEELVIPEAVIENGTETPVTVINSGAFANTNLKKIYIYSSDIELNGDNIFPDGVTIVCFENSSAHEYAISHGIEPELLKAGDSVTFEEEFYEKYAGENMLMQSDSAAAAETEYVTYNTKEAATFGPWYAANSYGFKIAQGSDGNYLNVNAGIYDDMNQFNQVYITLNNPKPTTETQTISFDVQFPSDSGDPYIEIQNESGVIDTIAGLDKDKWFRYELIFDGSTYTRKIYDNGVEISSDSLKTEAGEKIVSCIAFKQGYIWGNWGAQNGIVNIDNILIK